MTPLTCDDCLAHLDEHLDGSLAAADRAAIEAHLADCADCRKIADDAAFLRPLVAAWPREIEPARDLWPEVRAAIAPPARAGARPLRWLAAAVVLVGFGAGLGWVMHDRAQAPSPSLARSSGDKIDVARFEAQVDAASAELVAAVAAREHELDPETVATVQRNLAIIDAAIAETRRALAESPDDARIADALVAAHQQKIRMLRQVLWAPGING